MKPFKYIVPTLSCAQVLAKGSNSTFTATLDKPFQHMVPPLSHVKASEKSLNPNFRSICKASGVCRPFDHKTYHVKNTSSCTQNPQIYPGKKSVTKCGSEAGGTFRTNIETDQGISTPIGFKYLWRFPQEDNFTSSLDDLSSYRRIISHPPWMICHPKVKYN